ncbi:MAG: VanZ family protein [Chitinophagia bacterium]|jgi:glycopeptide antibiotics resistance protein
MIKKGYSLIFVIIYIGILFRVMVLKDVPMIRIGDLMLNFGGTQHGTFNLIPFQTIGAYFDGHKGFLIASINLLGNVLLLVPLGFLIPFVLSRFNWLVIIFLSIFSGLSIEIMQFILKVGIFDVDDVILNALGVMLGVVFYNLYQKVINKIAKRFLIISISIVTLFLIILTGFYYVEHNRFPIAFGDTDENGQKIFPGYREQSNLEKDPCNGGSGTGKIISLDNNSFVLKRADGIEQRIIILKSTSIKSSIGNLHQSDLKLGDRVTIITGPESDIGMTAELVLICGIRAKFN